MRSKAQFIWSFDVDANRRAQKFWWISVLCFRRTCDKNKTTVHLQFEVRYIQKNLKMKKFVCILQVFAGLYLLGAFVTGVSKCDWLYTTGARCGNFKFASLWWSENKQTNKQKMF